MLNFFYSLSFVTFLLIVWFKTDAFVQYCQLFGLKFLLLGYEENNNLTFPQYLYTKRLITPNKYLQFYFKLISCPICLGFWISLVFGALFCSLLAVPAVYISSLFLYLIFSKLLEY